MRLVLACSATAALLLVFSSLASADESVDIDLFRAANLLYEDGNFEEAARSYEYLAMLGYQDATLYYNLANAYHRTDDNGRAMLNYLRARRIAPLDEDIAANLALLRETIGTSDSRQQPVPVLAQLSERVPWVTINSAAVAALLCWTVLWAAGLIVWYNRTLHRSQTLRRVAVAAGLGLIVFGFLGIGDYVGRAHWSQVGVATADSTDVLASPSSRAPIRLTLDAGREVSVITKRAGWTSVRLPRTDLVGWVPSSTVDTVLLTGR